MIFISLGVKFIFLIILKNHKKGQLIRVIVNIEDDEDVQIIVDTLNECLSEESNCQGILRHIKTTQDITKERNFSGIINIHDIHHSIFIFIILFIVFLIFHK